MSDELDNRIAAQTSRGKVQSSAVASRTMLTISGLDGELFQNVELLLPPGYVARPAAGADVLIQQINGSRDHKVAQFGDNTVDAVENLQPGEIGLSAGGQTFILRQDRIELITPLKVLVMAGQEVSVIAPLVSLGAEGGKKVALDGDPVVDGKVQSSAMKTMAV